MSPGPGVGAVVGLALLAHDLNRDLQRAARAAGGAARLASLAPARGAAVVGCDVARFAGAMDRRRVAEARARCLRDGATVVESDALPLRLRQVFDPPFGLFAAGRWAATAPLLDERPVVAIVGSRHPSAAGAAFARSLAADLAAQGAVIVSGLALGIDAAAHEGALDAGGRTVAVLGCGLGHDYPRRNAGLRRRILEASSVVTEYWLDTEPAPWRFPARNRIVAGLADATVVIEARGRSGALITADFALELGRVVLAVPGWPWSEQSQGSNELIRSGAGVCLGSEDVRSEVPHDGWVDADTPAPPPPDGGEA